MNNASGNLKEVLNWIADGVDVQFYSKNFNEWRTPSRVEFVLEEDGLELEWRKKPDAFEEAWKKEQGSYLIGNSYNDTVLAADYFKRGWNAAMEHKK